MDIHQGQVRITAPLNEETRRILEQLCTSKVEEFEMLGYTNVYAQDIWDCVSEKYNHLEMPALYQMTNDILSLKSTTYMTWLSLYAIKDTQIED